VASANTATAAVTNRVITGFMVLPFFLLANWIVGMWGPEEAKEPSGEKVLRLIQDPFSDAEYGEN
jgi:hypothetical protein